MPNNFTRTINNPREARRAVEMFKDEYLLDFMNVEEIGEREKIDVDERVVEQSIVQNAFKNFIMTFGRDFAFIGNQYHLEIYGVRTIARPAAQLENERHGLHRAKTWRV